MWYLQNSGTSYLFELTMSEVESANIKKEPVSHVR